MMTLNTEQKDVVALFVDVLSKFFGEREVHIDTVKDTLYVALGYADVDKNNAIHFKVSKVKPVSDAISLAVERAQELKRKHPVTFNPDFKFDTMPEKEYWDTYKMGTELFWNRLENETNFNKVVNESIRVTTCTHTNKLVVQLYTGGGTWLCLHHDNEDDDYKEATLAKALEVKTLAALALLKTHRTPPYHLKKNSVVPALGKKVVQK